jgi:hypothetical protein
MKWTLRSPPMKPCHAADYTLRNLQSGIGVARLKLISFLISNSIPHCRGAMRPGFAEAFALLEQGRREGRAPAGTRDPVCG